MANADLRVSSAISGKSLQQRKASVPDILSVLLRLENVRRDPSTKRPFDSPLATRPSFSVVDCRIFRWFGICTVLLWSFAVNSQGVSIVGDWELVETSGKVSFEVSGHDVIAHISYESGVTGDGKGTFVSGELNLNIVWRNLVFGDERVNQRLNGHLPATWRLKIEDDKTLKGKRSISRVRWSDKDGELLLQVDEDVRRDPLTLVSLAEANDLAAWMLGEQ